MKNLFFCLAIFFGFYGVNQAMAKPIVYTCAVHESSLQLHDYRKFQNYQVKYIIHRRILPSLYSQDANTAVITRWDSITNTTVSLPVRYEKKGKYTAFMAPREVFYRTMNNEYTTLFTRTDKNVYSVNIVDNSLHNAKTFTGICNKQ